MTSLVERRPFYRGKVRLDPEGLRIAEGALDNDDFPDKAFRILQAYFRTVKGSQATMPWYGPGIAEYFSNPAPIFVENRYDRLPFQFLPLSYRGIPVTKIGDRFYQMMYRPEQWTHPNDQDAVIHDCGFRPTDSTLHRAQLDRPVCPRCNYDYQWVWLLRDELQ